MIVRLQERGVATVYFVLLAGAVIFGFMVMSIDFGRVYLVQGELQTAADAAALAAATQLVGTANATLYAGDPQTGQVGATFDNTDTFDNRFNLRLNQIGAGAIDLSPQILVDFFSSRLEALTPGGNGGATGPDAKYVKVTVVAQTPMLFLPFINPTFGNRQQVFATAVAGISAPMCTACNIDDLAVVAPDTSDELNWGFVPGDFYTFYMTASQQTPNITGCLATTPTTTPALTVVDNTDFGVEYVALNHVPSGPSVDIDGTMFELGAGPITQNPDPSLALPGTITIGTMETPATVQDPTTCTGAITAGPDVLCGLNARFGEVDPTTNNCASIASVDVLSAVFPPDTEVASGLDFEDYPTVYDGNLRRVLTVPVLDSSPDDNPTPNVIGFRQFLVENTPGNPGIDTTQATGSFVAQYIGYPVPLRCGGVGGSCTVSFGVGRTVLH